MDRPARTPQGTRRWQVHRHRVLAAQGRGSAWEWGSREASSRRVLGHGQRGCEGGAQGKESAWTGVQEPKARHGCPAGAERGWAEEAGPATRASESQGATMESDLSSWVLRRTANRREA